MEPRGSSPYSQEPSTGSYPQPDQSSLYHPILSMIHFNIILQPTSSTSQWPCTKSHLDFPNLRFFFQRIRLSSRPFVTFHKKKTKYTVRSCCPTSNDKVEDHPLSAVRNCLFSRYSQLSFICGGRVLHRNPKTHHDKGPF
jgi:hypothetical protein